MNKAFSMKFLSNLEEHVETLCTRNEDFLTIYEHVLITCMETYDDCNSVKHFFQLFKDYVLKLFKTKKYSKICELLALTVNNEQLVSFFVLLDEIEKCSHKSFIIDTVSEVKSHLLTKQFKDAEAPLNIINNIITAKKNLQLPLEYLMFDNKDWLSFHNDFSSKAWIKNKTMIKGDQCGLVLQQDEDQNTFLNESYLTAVSFFSDLCTNFSNELNIQIEDKKCVAVECLLVCSFCLETRLNLAFFADHIEILEHLLDFVLIKSLKYGNAWCYLLKTFLKNFSVNHQMMNLEMEKACNDIKSISIVQTLTVHISNLDTLKDVQEIAIKLHMKFLELQNDEPSFYKTGFYLSVLVETLDRMVQLDSVVYEEMVTSLIDNTSEFKNVFELESSIMNQNEQSINFSKGLLSLFNQVAKYLPLSKVSLSSDQWDSVLCALLTLVNSLQQSIDNAECLQDMNFYTLLFGCCKLVNRFNEYLKSNEANQDPSLPASLIREWEDFYLVNSEQALLSIYLIAVSNPSFKYAELILEIMCPIICKVEYTTLVSQAESLEKYVRPDCDYDDDVQTLIYSLMHHCSGVTLLDKFICNTLMNTLLCNSATLKHNKPPQKIMRNLYNLSVNVEADFFELKEAEKKRVKVKHLNLRKTDEDTLFEDEYFQGL